MRHTLLLAIVACASACATTRPTRTTFATAYTCGELEVVREGVSLRAASAGAVVPSSIGWSDDEGDHFVSFPSSPTDVDAVEFVVPHDPHADAIEKTYDTSQGRSRVDWRMTHKRVCRARGGYNDVFARWANGASIDQITSELALESRAHTREMVHRALVEMNKRYYASR